MAEIVRMPKLSDTMTEGVVAKWHKKIGDKVKSGELLADIETDKATMEFESFQDGVLLHIGVQEKQAAPVDSILAILGKQGEDISALLNGNDSPKTEVKVETTPPAENNSAAKAELPKGVEVVRMPKLSDTMTEGVVAKWHKKVGDKVKSGELLADIETDKATMEFESFQDGVLIHIGVEAGKSAPVDSVLAILGKGGEDVKAILAAVGTSTSSKSETVSAPKVETQVQKVAATVTSAATTTVSNKTTNGRVKASPLAKALAKEKGIDISMVSGSGDNGRITKKDIETFTPGTSKKSFFTGGVESFTDEPASQMRKTIARRLSESKFTAPHYYLTIEVAMDEAMKSRAIINTVPDTKVSFNDMVVKACAMALKKHPQVNTQWKEDVTVINHHVNIGVAVAVEDGLVVPVLKFTDQMSLTQIGTAVKDLAGRAKNKKLQPAEMEGSTFTVSNLGMFGITEFTSIINQPNSAILSVGAIIEKPVVRNGQIVVGNTMKITLACDHRTVDGATGAQFLQTLRTYLENPVTMLA